MCLWEKMISKLENREKNAEKRKTHSNKGRSRWGNWINYICDQNFSTLIKESPIKGKLKMEDDFLNRRLTL